MAWLVGLNIEHDRENQIMKISQQQYTEKILKKFRMQDSIPVATPMVIGANLRRPKEPPTYEEQEEMKQIPYRQAIGSLLYLSMGTRPDIAYAVAKMAQFCHCYRPVHWKAVQRIFKYLKGTASHGLIFESREHLNLEAWVDASFGEDLDTRKSTSGFVVTLGGKCITWKSKKQTLVALSTLESEYYALSEVTKEISWLRTLLEELHLPQMEPTLTHEDNQGCIATAHNPKNYQRTKHIEIKYHWVRHKIREGALRLQFCPSSDMMADILTKPLPIIAHQRHMEKMKLAAVDSRGSVEIGECQPQQFPATPDQLEPEGETERQE